MIIVFLQWDAQNYLTLYLFPIKRNSKIGFFFLRFVKKCCSLCLLSIRVLSLCCLTGKERKKELRWRPLSHSSFPLITVLYIYFSYFLLLSLPNQISIPHSMLINWDGVWGKLIYRYEFHMAKCSPTITHQMEFDTRNGQFSYLSYDT